MNEKSIQNVGKENKIPKANSKEVEPKINLNNENNGNNRNNRNIGNNGNNGNNTNEKKMLFDLKRLKLNNIFKNTSQIDVEKYAFYLTNQNPVSSKQADEINGTWIVEFSNEIGILFY